MGLFDKITGMFKEDTQPQRPMLGRNDPCWCGSGLKYKKCHLQKDSEQSKTVCSSGGA